jgi:hypothetical protein
MSATSTRETNPVVGVAPRNNRNGAQASGSARMPSLRLSGAGRGPLSPEHEAGRLHRGRPLPRLSRSFIADVLILRNADRGAFARVWDIIGQPV